MYLLGGLHIDNCDVTNSIYLRIDIEVAVNGMCNFVVFIGVVIDVEYVFGI
jgi:hypothetical protein